VSFNEKDLQRALAVRIGMQISVSSLPIVEEKMDIDLDRFIDSVPLPPEVPTGTAVDIEVSIGTDLRRVRWSAFGHPGGFIPKMADYLNRCGVLPVDIALINGMGDAIQPSLVGMWIAIGGGGVRTGWQFRETRAVAELQPFMGNDFGIAKLMAWVARRDVDFYRLFARSIGADPTSRVELPLPGETVDAQLDMAASAFEDLAAFPLPAAVRDAIAGVEAPRAALGFELSGGDLRATSLIADDLGPDVIQSLCAALGLTRDDTLPKIATALKADGVTRVEYRHTADGDSVDLMFIPGELEDAPAGPGKN
jgi:hypothetical protein